jgi:hypothetical protein
VTPTTTGAVPQLHEETEIDDPRTMTVAYYADGEMFGSPRAEPAATDPAADRRSVADVLTELEYERARGADLETRLRLMTATAQDANRDATEAAHRAADAEALLELARATAARLSIPAAFDSACRAITGRSYAQVSRDLERQLAEHEDDETVVVDVTAPVPARRLEATVRGSLARERPDATLDREALFALADLADRLLAAERAIAAHESAGHEPPYPLVVARDAARGSLARAIAP